MEITCYFRANIIGSWEDGEVTPLDLLRASFSRLLDLDCSARIAPWLKGGGYMWFWHMHACTLANVLIRNDRGEVHECSCCFPRCDELLVFSKELSDLFCASPKPPLPQPRALWLLPSRRVKFEMQISEFRGRGRTGICANPGNSDSPSDTLPCHTL